VRLDIQMGMETKIGVVVPGGHLNFMVQGQLCEALRKHELEVSYLDRKDGSNVRGPYPGGLIPHDSESRVEPESEFAHLMDNFDAIDRNLIRAASIKVLEIMATEVRIGESTYGGGEPDQGAAEQKTR
jgi:hypothetical protein